MKLSAACLSAEPRIAHGFFTRRGGVSEGIYTSLNCGLGSQDNPDAVAENRARAATQLGVLPEHLLTCYQFHSTEVLEVSGPWDSNGPRRADGLVTTTPGLALGILTADCLPVLLADSQAGVVGAAHAGWKGALGGVLEATLSAMQRLGAETDRITAATGPAISVESYEVGPEFRDRFLQDSAEYDRFFVPGSNGRPHFDLKGFAHARLHAAGVRQVEMLPQDTCSAEDDFFSYRRACHRGEQDYGRGLSAICLET
ncbi:peptidoglycan editing factor PgeF [Fodinicurvata halophila]|uniref:Purine nucleoside phosphorylase n=1 Tax=Fodinicurvata halophila TaxID=1419723 RepID=A0ABV8UNB5_9PROT